MGITEDYNERIERLHKEMRRSIRVIRVCLVALLVLAAVWGAGTLFVAYVLIHG